MKTSSQVRGCPLRSRSRAAGAARTRAGRAPASPGGTRASPRARPRSSASRLGLGDRGLVGRRSRSSRLVLGRRAATRSAGGSGAGSGSAGGPGSGSGSGSGLGLRRPRRRGLGLGSSSRRRRAAPRRRSSSTGAGGLGRRRRAAASAAARCAAARAPRAPGARPRRVGAVAALELEVLADGVVEQSHVADRLLTAAGRVPARRARCGSCPRAWPRRAPCRPPR